VDACSHGVEQFRLTKQVWRLPQVHAPVRPVPHTIGCCPTLPLTQCHEAKRTVPNSHEQGANSSTDNNSEAASISCSTDESSDTSSEGTSVTSNSSTVCDSHLKQQPMNQVAQQVAFVGQSLRNPRSGEESRPCFVHPQPLNSLPVVLTNSTPVTPRCSPLLPFVHLAPPALRFPVLSCGSRREPSSAPDADSSKKRTASVTSQRAM